MICRLKGFVSWLKENYDDYIKKRSPIASSQGAFMSERLDPIAEQKKNRPPSQRGKSEAINNYQLFALSDVGNSERFVYHNQRKARFCHQMGKSGQWFIWDGLRWRPDETNQIRGLAEDTVRRIYTSECGNEADEARRKALARHALKSESRTSLDAMITLAQHKAPMPLTIRQMDQDNDSILWANTAINLRTGETFKPSAVDNFTMASAVHYDPMSTCPRWELFLDQVFSGNVGLIDWIQRAIGYSLTGRLDEQCFFFLHGNGSNGKSKFILVLRALLGDYGIKIPTAALMRGGNDISQHELARTPGKRLCVAAETGGRDKFDEELLKDITGDEIITGRQRYLSTFEFRPKIKLWIYGNSMPKIAGTDEGIWRRVRLIPFKVQFDTDDNPADPDLEKTLMAELPGIAAWAVQGALRWYQEGLGIVDAVKVATGEYRKDMDLIAEYINEECVVGPTFQATAADLFRIFRQWTTERNEFCMSQRAFGRELTRRGYERDRGTNGVHIWRGIGIRA